MPDYEFILWDKNRFDIHSVKLVEDACEARKWAVAADYIRMYALYTEGGIYLDSDVMVFRRFDTFLNHTAFSAVEYYPQVIASRSEKDKHDGYAIEAAVIGAEKGNEWIKMTMEYYRETEFKMREDGFHDVEVIPKVLAHYAHLYYGFQYDMPLDKPQYLKDGIVIYSPKVFTHTYGETDMHTYAIHIVELSWVGDKVKLNVEQELPIKKQYKKLCYNYRFINMLHWKRKQIGKKRNFFIQT